MKNLTNTVVRKSPCKYISTDVVVISIVFYDIYDVNLWERKTNVFIIFHHFVNILNQWESMGSCKQIPGGNLSRLAGMKTDFPM